MDENDSRIPVLFSLTSSCAASFAAFKGKVLEACGLSRRKNVQFFYLLNDLKLQLYNDNDDDNNNNNNNNNNSLLASLKLTNRGYC